MPAVAPAATALTMSLPRRTPPSQMISVRPPTASATGATSVNVAGAPSSWRPPWFDSAMASTPASAASTASSTVCMPFSTIGPSHTERSQSTSSHDSDGIELGVDVVGERDRRGAVADVAADDVGEADRLAAHERPRPPRVERAVDDRARPDRRRQREPAPHVALAPPEHRGVDGEHERLVVGARPARSIISLTRPRSRHAYTWNHSRPSLTARTSSIDRVLRVESVYGRSGPRRGAGDGELALGVGDAGEAGRREHERVARAAGRGASTPVVDLRRRRAGPRGRNVTRGEGGLVGGERALVLGAAVDVVEHAPGKAALGDAAQVVDRRRAATAGARPVGLDAPEAHDRAQRLVTGSRRLVPPQWSRRGDARSDRLQRRREGAVGAGLDDDITERGGLRRAGDDRNPPGGAGRRRRCVGSGCGRRHHSHGELLSLRNDPAPGPTGLRRSKSPRAMSTSSRGQKVRRLGIVTIPRPYRVGATICDRCPGAVSRAALPFSWPAHVAVDRHRRLRTRQLPSALLPFNRARVQSRTAATRFPTRLNSCSSRQSPMGIRSNRTAFSTPVPRIWPRW